MKAEVSGRRPRGWPKFGWMDAATQALGRRDLSVEVAIERAVDRREWRIWVSTLPWCAFPPLEDLPAGPFSVKMLSLFECECWRGVQGAPWRRRIAQSLGIQTSVCIRILTPTMIKLMTFDVQIKTNNNDNEYETLVVNYLRFISFILWILLLYFFPLFHIPKFRVISSI